MFFRGFSGFPLPFYGIVMQPVFPASFCPMGGNTHERHPTRRTRRPGRYPETPVPGEPAARGREAGGIKYTDAEILEIIADDQRPVYVFAPEGQVLGYVFCVFEETNETDSLRPVRTLYIDDLCVDETARGQHIGQRLYDRAVRLARDSGCARVTLHAWNFNEKAFGFYRKLGMAPLYTTMEQRL